MSGVAALTHILNRASSIMERFGILALRPQLDACRKLLATSTTLQVGVFGRYKAGKSSFLNALAGQDDLPAGVLPVTAVITRLRYGECERAQVHYHNGKMEDIGVETVGQYVSEAGNPKNEKQVTIVSVELPSLKRLEGLEFIDTPGLGSVLAHNTQASMEWLPYAGAALVVISVDNPISEDDALFIDELRRFTPRIVVLLTKADRVSDADLEAICGFTRRELERRFKFDIPVFPFSSRPNGARSDDGRAAAWKLALEEQLLAPLAARGADENRRILLHKINSLLVEASDYLKVALSAAARTEEERERIRQHVLEENKSLHFVREELRLLAHQATSQTLQRFGDHLSGRKRPLRARLAADLGARLRTWRVNLWKLTRAYEKWLHEAFSRELGAISRQEHDAFMAAHREAAAAMTHILENFRDRLALRIEEALGVKVAPMEASIRVAEPQAPDVSFSRVFDFHLDSLWFLIPVGLFRPLIDRYFLSQIGWEVEKNLSRLASVWSERVNQAILEMQKEAVLYVRRQIATVESVLGQRESQRLPIQRALNELDELERRLETEHDAVENGAVEITQETGRQQT